MSLFPCFNIGDLNGNVTDNKQTLTVYNNKKDRKQKKKKKEKEHQKHKKQKRAESAELSLRNSKLYDSDTFSSDNFTDSDEELGLNRKKVAVLPGSEMVHLPNGLIAIIDKQNSGNSLANQVDFVFDRSGDSDIIEFGKIHQKEIPSYVTIENISSESIAKNAHKLPSGLVATSEKMKKGKKEFSADKARRYFAARTHAAISDLRTSRWRAVKFKALRKKPSFYSQSQSQSQSQSLQQKSEKSQFSVHKVNASNVVALIMTDGTFRSNAISGADTSFGFLPVTCKPSNSDVQKITIKRRSDRGRSISSPKCRRSDLDRERDLLTVHLPVSTTDDGCGGSEGPVDTLTDAEESLLEAQALSRLLDSAYKQSNKQYILAAQTSRKNSDSISPAGQSFGGCSNAPLLLSLLTTLNAQSRLLHLQRRAAGAADSSVSKGFIFKQSLVERQLEFVDDAIVTLRSQGATRCGSTPSSLALCESLSSLYQLKIKFTEVCGREL